MADGSNAEQPKEKEEVEKEKAKDARKEKGKEKDGDKKMENEKEKGKSLDVANFERLLQRLPGCVSRDLIDQLTVRVLEMVFYLMLYLLNLFSPLFISMVVFPGGILLFKFQDKQKKTCQSVI